MAWYTKEDLDRQCFYKIIKDEDVYKLLFRHFPHGNEWNLLSKSYSKEELYVIIEDDVKRRKEKIENTLVEYYDYKGERVWIP